MAIATVTFRKCILNSQEFERDDNWMGSRVFFDLEINSERYPNLYTDVKQHVGVGAEHEFLEVTKPQGYVGPFNFPVFRGSVEFYYRHVVGAHGSMFGMPGIKMRPIGYVLEQEMRVQFEVLEGD